MEYNDEFGSIDLKNFEQMAKEYAKIENTKIDILQENRKFSENFIGKYEEVLTILMKFYREFDDENEVFFDENFDLKKAKIKEVISGFCALYKELKNDYFFTAFACEIGSKIGDKNRLKNEVENEFENLLILSAKSLPQNQQKCLINLCFEMIRLF